MTSHLVIRFLSLSPQSGVTEVTYIELRNDSTPANDTIGRWAVEAQTVRIKLDVAPQTVFQISADGWATASTLSGSNEPAFPASYHDIILHGVLQDGFVG